MSLEQRAPGGGLGHWWGAWRAQGWRVTVAGVALQAVMMMRVVLVLVEVKCWCGLGAVDGEEVTT